jgi:hypothetical protein
MAKQLKQHPGPGAIGTLNFQSPLYETRTPRSLFDAPPTSTSTPTKSSVHLETCTSQSYTGRFKPGPQLTSHFLQDLIHGPLAHLPLWCHSDQISLAPLRTLLLEAEHRLPAHDQRGHLAGHKAQNPQLPQCAHMRDEAAIPASANPAPSSP